MQKSLKPLPAPLARGGFVLRTNCCGNSVADSYKAISMQIPKRYSASIIKALIAVLVLSILTHFPGAFSVDLCGAKVEYVGSEHLSQMARVDVPLNDQP